ncbi:class IV adenylate cyclase [bacterium]|uniref:Adenylyl cyclase CyaB n=1 Tax=Rubinisphaera brasiliensis (strain ATCC 49424 / DSM 5305 / JCM 21570 / IAM 15109 / NBRC 103401 / IFAM 1448) TaxID=756272 RepID=F0SM33_RUBBR|nr:MULTISPECIES: class IV adenylate cyclase [Rubinisphaera]ADY60988.1 adenylyl cyclase CyaB [Rubinisphaera brasiliensis DSM 5305]MBB01501.1 class IV adenylate cyclase [Planctomyces sp.]MBR9804560.1 class IV adenylate cyclase [bacterium]
MPFEVEVKYPLPDEAAFRKQLEMLGAHFVESIRQEDDYLSHPSRDFAKTDEAFRIRCVGPQNRITFKGPLLDQETKSREEFEVLFAEGDAALADMRTVFSRLGFDCVYQVAKQRDVFELKRPEREYEIVIDRVDNLGVYVELECVADESDRDAAREDILALAKSLELGPTVERRSYLRLLLEKQGQSS